MVGYIDGRDGGVVVGSSACDGDVGAGLVAEVRLVDGVVVGKASVVATTDDEPVGDDVVEPLLVSGAAAGMAAVACESRVGMATVLPSTEPASSVSGVSIPLRRRRAELVELNGEGEAFWTTWCGDELSTPFTALAELSLAPTPLASTEVEDSWAVTAGS